MLNTETQRHREAINEKPCKSFFQRFLHLTLSELEEFNKVKETLKGLSKKSEMKEPISRLNI